MLPDDVSAAHIADYLMAETQLAPADLIFVFGCRWPEQLAARAAELYAQGYARTILVSGGVDTDAGIPEWLHISRLMIAKGVPASAILVEKEARHTGENAALGRAVAEAALGRDSVGSVICVGAVHASRRYAMTLERHWPGPVKMLSAVSGFDTPKERWIEDETFRRNVLIEWAKLAPYFAQDFLREIDLAATDRWAQTARAAATAAKRPPAPSRRRPAAPNLRFD